VTPELTFRGLFSQAPIGPVCSGRGRRVVGSGLLSPFLPFLAQVEFLQLNFFNCSLLCLCGIENK
jgi:hypothetical protein